jgi:hypothetical protein
MCGTAENTPNKAFQIVAPGELAAVWPSIRDEVAEIATHAPDGWIPEQVFTALALNQASLHLGYIDKRLVGWMVVRVLDEYDGRRLHVWLMYASNKTCDLFETFGDEFDALARSVGAKRITFSTTRRGWERTAPHLGFDVRSVVYQRGVQ